MKHLTRSMASFLALALVAIDARGAAISVDTHGGRATGMGTAVVATTTDATAVFYNPAGILMTDGLQVMAGDTAILAQLSFRSQESGALSTAERVPSLPPHAYLTANLGDRLAMGLGFFVNYGNSARWPTGWEFQGRAQQSSLATMQLNPEVAYAVLPWLRLGAGAQLVRASLTTSRVINFLDEQAQVTLDGVGYGIGANAGLQADFLENKVSFGLSYRSAVTLGFNGRARFTDVPEEVSSTLVDQRAVASMRLPDTVFAGVAARPIDGLTIAADAHYFRWSLFDRVAIEFPEDTALNQTFWKRWQDTISYHLGAEYVFRNGLSLRAGAVYDPTPSPSDTLTMDLPDSTRIKGALGVGYRLHGLTVDVGYQYVHLIGSASTAPGYEGSYSGFAHLASATLGYRL